ncbi:hypothetical protein PR202_gb03440 [Eleusine coracana subsp. coracana]|uniref:F-box domain-containing protein n=1 Tax=Eleusine coracana subsp. coracana TaxID=191504 RepID=A0AAV5E1U1_ELECO|nr:hypothetical protein PR202_gb03440 [Eleusine coracana subsp. coracana]
MSAETSYSPPAWKKVLGNDDLLGEILHRVDSPTTLVRAAAVAKRWLRVASGRVFLRRYRARATRRASSASSSPQRLPAAPGVRPHEHGPHQRRRPPRRRLRVRHIPRVLVLRLGQPQRPRPPRLQRPHPAALRARRAAGPGRSHDRAPAAPASPGRPLPRGAPPRRRGRRRRYVLPRGRPGRRPQRLR